MPGFVGFPELLLLGLVVLVLFGPKRLPEMGRGLGKGLREFKDSVTGENKDAEVFAVPVELTAAPTAVEEAVAPNAETVAVVRRDVA